MLGLDGIPRDLDVLFAVGAIGGLSDGELLDRFVASGDRAAFAALVDRHAPMVLSACRGVLGRGADVDDAFQATFLILARKARTLRRGASVGAWLYRVARRVALQAAADGARRRAREARAALPEAQESPGPGPWDDAIPVLHEELDRLPEKYRAPLVLCELEALTRDQAAGVLGWPPGTVAGRLARGRDLLRSRLIRRGVAPGALVTALVAAREAGAAVPPSWVASTSAASADSVETLAREVMNAMFRSKLRRLAIGGLMMGLTLGLALTALVWAREPSPELPPVQQTKGDEATVPISGVVTDPDGRPAAGVFVYGSVFVMARWGTVVAETLTDAQGKFHLAFPADASRKSPRTGGAIWAYRPGSLIATYPIRAGNVHSDVPLRLAVGPASSATIEVVDPDGKTVAGAHVMPRVLARDYLSVPDALAQRIAADTVTDARGRARLTAFLPEEIGTVFVQAPGFGTQQFGFGHHGEQIGVGVKVVHLMRVGRVEGRLVGDPAEVGGVPLQVAIWNRETNPPPPPAIGLFDVKTDASGRFVLPEAPEGTLSVSGTIANQYVESPSKGLMVEAGKTTSAEFKVRKSVVVRGRVLEKGTGKPIEGVELTTLGDEESGKTDASGRFELHTRRGPTMLLFKHIPPGYARLMYGVPQERILEEDTEYAWPQIELSPATDRKGRVVDDQDRPVPGAQVEASWQVDEGPGRQGLREVGVTTDSRGEFVVADVPVGAQLRLAASAGVVGRTEGTVTDPPEPIVLKLKPTELVSLRGQVFDEANHPFPNARVHLRRRQFYESGQVKGDVAVDFDGVILLRTDSEGRFETPRALDPEARYSAVAEADGRTTVRTDWVPGRAGVFPDLILEKADPAAER